MSRRRTLTVVATAVAATAAAVLAAVGLPQEARSATTVTAPPPAAGGAAAVAAGAGALSVTSAPCPGGNPPATASYPPLSPLPTPGSMPSSSTVLQTIVKRGTLVVGVSGDTRLLGARNPLAKGQLQGFDIDVSRQIARAILGDENKVRFVVVTAAQRIPFLQNGTVDLVARAMTMTCDRWGNADPTKRVAFSQVYFEAQQDVLVGKDRAGSWTSVQALQDAKAKVCAPKGSTSIATLQKFPGIVGVEKDIHSDCLAAWQQGEVDAITGDNAILAGFADQDARTAIVRLGLESEPYGLAAKPGDKVFVQFLNAVLQRMVADGTWERLRASNLGDLQSGPGPKQPDTSRSLTWSPTS